MAGLALKRIQAEKPGLEIETVEVTTNPFRTWRDGIRMIPALRCGDQVLSGITMSRKTIASFMEGIDSRT